MAGETNQATAPGAATSAKDSSSATQPAVGARFGGDTGIKEDLGGMLESELAKELGDEQDTTGPAGKGGKKPEGKGASQKPSKAAKAAAGDDGDDEDEQGDSDDDDAEDLARRELESDEDDEDEGEQEDEAEGSDEGDDADADADDKEKDNDPQKDKSKAVPRGMEGWPPAAIERFQRQDEQVKKLKEQLSRGAVKLEPVASSPLAHIETLEELDKALASARSVREWVRAHPNGGTIKNGDTTTEITEAQAREKLAHAEARIDAYAEHKELLKERELTKPWEHAERLVPDIFDKDSEAHKKFAYAMTTPLAEMPDREYFVACAIRGLQMDADEREGKARYVRIELDKDGKPVPRKREVPNAKGEKTTQQRNGGDATKSKPKPKAPSSQKPPLKAGNGKPDKNAAMDRWNESKRESDLDAVLAAELA